MVDVTFITGNQNKANFLAKYLGRDIKHYKLDLDEIQSLDFRTVAEHKVHQAYELIKSPVLVEDVGVHFMALGRLPGTFTKFFIDEIGNDGLCRLLDGYDNRSAIAEICFAYFDGKKVDFFDGKVKGHIADTPRGEDGFGWNPIFVPDGADRTYAEMNDMETEKYSLRTTTVFPQLREFFDELDKE